MFSKNTAVSAVEEGGHRGLSGNSLKWIAMLCMLLDHTAYVLVWEKIALHPGVHGTADHLRMTPTVILYFVMRGIGRIAFPIFIFHIVQGFQHTRNRIVYFARLLLFAFVSEIPFDMAFTLTKAQIKNGMLWEYEYQNVFFTLAIGLFLITAIDTALRLQKDRVACGFTICVALAVSLLTEHALRADYDYIGVLAIVVVYILRDKPLLAMGAAVTVLLFVSLFELPAYVSILLIARYSGERGRGGKWIFYLFYPVHLLVLAGIRLLVGFR